LILPVGRDGSRQAGHQNPIIFVPAGAIDQLEVGRANRDSSMGARGYQKESRSEGQTTILSALPALTAKHTVD
jgi:hypothetical protein